MNRRTLFLLAALLAPGLLPDPLPAQWVRRVSGTGVRLTDVEMLDSITAVAVGYARTILKTTDGGESWSKKLSLGVNLNAVSFSDPATGVAVGDNRTLLRTTDAGETWTAVAVGGLGSFLGVAHPDPDRIYIGNDRGTLRFTTNAGVSWKDTSLGSLALTDVLLLRGSGEVSYSGLVISPYTSYRSTDNGGTWTLQEFPLAIGGTALRGTVNQAGSYFAVGYDASEPPFARIMRRRITDSTWISHAFPPPGPSVVLRDIATPSALVGYVCGSGGTILRTLDGGATWSTEHTGTTRRLNAVAFFNDRYGVVVGDSGFILTTVNGTTGIAGPDPLLPREPALLPNTPNPFNPSTSVSFDLPAGTVVTLAVYDLLGRRVVTLADGYHGPGRHTVSFDAAGLAAGVYLARLDAGAFTATRKMLLLR
jgi:photosystem II stability/assembly factor-like uncharacterized protein